MKEEDETAICAREDCEQSYYKAVHNQKYCSPECCRVVTNRRLIDQYHARKSKGKKGKERICNRKDCTTILSSYNSENICESCKTKRLHKRLERWGWNVGDDFEI